MYQLQKLKDFTLRYLILGLLYVTTSSIYASSSKIPKPIHTADLDKGDYASYFSKVAIHYVQQFIPVIFMGVILVFIGAVIWAYNRSRKEGEWGTFNSTLGFGLLLVALIIGSIYVLSLVVGSA